MKNGDVIVFKLDEDVEGKGIVVEENLSYIVANRHFYTNQNDNSHLVKLTEPCKQFLKNDIIVVYEREIINSYQDNIIPSTENEEMSEHVIKLAIENIKQFPISKNAERLVAYLTANIDDVIDALKE